MGKTVQFLPSPSCFLSRMVLLCQLLEVVALLSRQRNWFSGRMVLHQ